MAADTPTVKESIIAYLGDPPIYMGFPVDMSSLDQPIRGYVVKGMRRPS